MKIIALLLAFTLTGCTGDRLRSSITSATRDQVATAMEQAETTVALVRDRFELKPQGRQG
jgi:hypothetical protein